jgi:nucleotide-binding universal stress UspA family protein
MYTRILIPTDGSQLAARGVNHGLSLAKALGAKAFVLTVTEPWSRIGMGELAGEAGGLDAIAEYSAALEKQAREVLAAVERQATEQGLEVELLLLRDRHVAEGILAAVEEHDINLVVMSSHGRRGMAKVLLGSQTFEVITQGRIPVLVIR